MIETNEFRRWLKLNTNYSEFVVTDIVSRIGRADRILPWNSEETYPFYLERNSEFQKLSTSVKSQIRKAVKLYSEFKTNTSMEDD